MIAFLAPEAGAWRLGLKGETRAAASAVSGKKPAALFSVEPERK
ncbi:hypothetical protein [Caulobacter sp. UC70_42]|jgi:hypothetical protein